MQRTTTQQVTGSQPFTVILDEEVAAYIDQEKITDVNAYIVKLLREEKNRQKGGAPSAQQVEKFAPNAN